MSLSLDKEKVQTFSDRFANEIRQIQSTAAIIETITALYDSAYDSLVNIARAEARHELVRRADRAKATVKNAINRTSPEEVDRLLKLRSVCEVVSSLEDFLKQLFCHLVEETEATVLGKKNFPKKLVIKKAFLSQMGTTGISKNLGAILIEDIGNSISFQDLKSIKRTFEQYLGIKLEECVTRYEEEMIILLHAHRHAITHDKAKVTSKFLSQLSNTKFAQNYKMDDTLNIDTNLLEEFSKTVAGVVRNIVGLIGASE